MKVITEENQPEQELVRALIEQAHLNTQQAYASLLEALAINAKTRVIDLSYSDKLLALANNISITSREITSNSTPSTTA
jgi:hypothetical protein